LNSLIRLSLAPSIFLEAATNTKSECDGEFSMGRGIER